MPANLPPEYFAVEKRYRAARTPEEKIACLEELFGTIPKHKGTDRLRADLRKKIAKLKAASQTRKGVSKQVSAFHIDREGVGQVVVVGPANVGKSALVAALTNATPEVADYPFTTWTPTPGMMPVEDIQVQLIDTPPLNRDFVEPELMNLIRRSDLILLVVDAREGLQPLDRAVAAKLRRHSKPVLLVANKVDSPDIELQLGELHALGMGEPLAVSAVHRLGTADLLDAVAERIGPPAETPDEPVMKIAIVGKRNVGKSTFINALAGTERVIVSEVPGTTRDSVDVRVDLDGQTLLVIDTAGVRKRRKLADDVEFYSRHRALRSIRRADVVLCMIDATQPVGRVDKQLAEYVSGLFKPAVLVINKWDLAESRADREEYAPYLSRVLPEVAYAPVVLTCATTGTGVREAIQLAGSLFEQSRRRVSTGELNAVIEAASARHSPKRTGGAKPGRIYYATQVATAPPTLVLFVNNIDAFDNAYRRYLLNQLRDRLPFPEVPIRLLFRPRRRGRE